MATVRIFNLENKLDNTKILVKAETKAQVNALVRANFIITPVGAVEALDMVSAGTKVVDATQMVVGANESSEETAEPNETPVAVQSSEAPDEHQQAIEAP